MIRTRAIALVVLMISGTWTIAAPLDPTTELARRHTTACLEGKGKELWPRLSEQFQAALGNEAAFVGFCNQLRDGLGTDVEILSEKTGEVQGMRTYSARIRFEKPDQVFNVEWAFGEQDRIQGFAVRPDQAAAESPHLDYATKTRLRLPFDGEWWVFWGGRTADENYHVQSVDQRFAYDLVVVEDRASHRNEGLRNEDYHCWDRPILAPAAGVVVVALDEIPDNVPGEMNASAPPGNHVVLDHGNEEFSFLAHLRRGSVVVQEGDKVDSGQKLGTCGNSGNSSEPHLHYHLQNTPSFGDGEGLPAPFVDYVADGEPVASGEPTRGQRIARRK